MATCARDNIRQTVAIVQARTAYLSTTEDTEDMEDTEDAGGAGGG
jgi:hypothetical protein